MGFNLTVTDPAANNRVIFKGQYYYDLLPDSKYRVSVMIQQSDSHYYIMPTLESPTEQFTAHAGIQVQDQDSANQAKLQQPLKAKALNLN